ncbi:MAG: HAMP domain-containing sensor histidine kinase [Pseudomonadota bacterium]|nr:HAMP domain-containing sensor histidine kinase [Pseudomonadota bacterium]
MHAAVLNIFLDLLFVTAGAVAAGYLWTHARAIQFAGAVLAVQLLSVGIVSWSAYYFADLVLMAAGPALLEPAAYRAWMEVFQDEVRMVWDSIAVSLMLVGFVMLLRRLGTVLRRLQTSTDALQLELVSRDTLEAELKTEAETERSQRQSKSEFLLGLSHELQTPLNGILGLASLLSNTEVDAEQRRLLATLEQSAQAMLNRVSDVLDLSLLENHRVELRSAAFEPCELIRSSVALFEPLAAERGLTLTARCEASARQPVIGDPGRVKQILTHLVSNAVKFTPDGSVTVDGRVEPIDSDHARLTFTVTDTGEGMAPEALEAAGQARDLRTGAGSGVGLSICWRLVHLMEGELEFDSTPGRGTVATARLVLQIDPTADGALDSDL